MEYGSDLTLPTGSEDIISETTFTYDLQGRMKTTVVDTNGSDDTGGDTTTTYEYDDSGIRISKTVDGVTTLFVVDKNNPTGYAQVLEEGEDIGNGGKLDDGEIDKSYVIGHDVIAQATNAAIQYLMYDGHGSTRAL